jgi:HEAT repeat protein
MMSEISDESESRRGLAEDRLPPVEPPTAGFLLQLFVVPGIIVTLIVLVWLLFSWLARGSSDLSQLVKRIRVPSEARFQAAHELASALGSERHSDFKHNDDAARELADILDNEIDDGGLGEKPVNLRIFLCLALGEFQVDDGIDALLKAAQTQRGSEEVYVRQAAITALVRRAESAQSESPSRSIEHPQLEPVLLTLAKDRERLVREVTAVALGRIGGDAARSALVTLLDDVDPNVRYNAAASLARRGGEESVRVLAEMLDPRETAGVEAERMDQAKPLKRARIVDLAIRATGNLADANAQADLSTLIPLLEQVRDEDPERAVRFEAGNLLARLRRRAEGGAAVSGQ